MAADSEIVTTISLNATQFRAQFDSVLEQTGVKARSFGNQLGASLTEGLDGGLRGFASRIPVIGNALSGLGGAATIAAGAIGVLGTALAFGVRETESLAQAQRRLDSVLVATGNKTGFVRDQLFAFAEELEGAIAVSAEEILRAQAALATFDGVAGSTFERVIRLAADLSATFGGDIAGNAEKLGTILQNLNAGSVEGLARGFKFLGAEVLGNIRALAEAGDVAGAQAALFAALEQRVGGAAAGQAQGLTGAFFRLRAAISAASREAAQRSGAYDGLTSAINSAADAAVRLTEKLSQSATRVREYFAGLEVLKERAAKGSFFGTERIEADLMAIFQPGRVAELGAARLAPQRAREEAERRQREIDAQRAADEAIKRAQERVRAEQAAARAAAEAAQKEAEARRRAAETERAARARVADATRDAAAATRELEAAYASITARYLPLTAAEERRVQTLRQIAQLERAGRLSAEQAAAARAAIEYERATPSIDRAQLEAARDLAREVRAEQERFEREVEDTIRAMARGVRTLEVSIDRALSGSWDEFTQEGLAAISLLSGAIGGNLGRAIGGIAGLLGSASRNIGGGPVGAGFSAAIRDAFRPVISLFERALGTGPNSLGATLGRAAGGMAVGSQVSSILSGIFGGRLATRAANIGGQIGGAAGSALPIPGGTLIGSVAGSLLGSLFATTPKGSATLAVGDGGLTRSVTGTKNAQRDAAGSLGDSVIQALDRIAQQLGGRVTGPVSVSIGQRGDNFRVDTTGRGNTSTRNAGVLDFGRDQAAAIRAAVTDAIRDGVIDGLDEATRRLLAAGVTDAQLDKAVRLRTALRDAARAADPLGEAIRELNEEFAALAEIAREAGLSQADLAKLSALYDKRLQDVSKAVGQTTRQLEEFLKSLRAGPSSPFSLGDQRRAALAEFEEFEGRAAVGEQIDEDAFIDAARKLLDIERQIFGSTASFFTTLGRVEAAVQRALANVQRPAAPAVAPRNPFAPAGPPPPPVAVEPRNPFTRAAAINPAPGAANLRLALADTRGAPSDALQAALARPEAVLARVERMRGRAAGDAGDARSGRLLERTADATTATARSVDLLLATAREQLAALRASRADVPPPPPPSSDWVRG